MTLISTIKHILLHYLKVFLEKFFYNLPEDVLIFRKDCENLVERYNTILKEISTYMKDHSKNNDESIENSGLILSYRDTDTFHIISIKEDLAILNNGFDSYVYNNPGAPYFIQNSKLE